ncbi:MAG TPA: protein kinase [Myxococcota bacterium]|nr:protein kinase [Myxococcota bacterium]
MGQRLMQPGDTLASRFVIEALAAAGGMGKVYRARDTLSGATVALKVLRAADAGERAERFAREARLLAEISHPAIVRYVDHGTTGEGERWLAMEWLDGETLEARLRRASLDVPQTLALAARVAEALGMAHRRGIVHRDVKPSNLFLQDGRLERVKMLDFGVAALTNVGPGASSTGGAGAGIGTPGYMAPEQARGGPDVDARADVFSLGCVLFECLTGRPPFLAEHAIAVLAKILLEEVPLPGQLVPGVPPALDTLVGSMLAKDAARRPADAGAVLAALDELGRAVVADAGPTAARGEGTPARALGREEQRVLSVVLAAPLPESAAGGEGAEAGTRSGGEARLAALRTAVAPSGAAIESLAGGTFVATLVGRGSATDRAAAAARCALTLRAALPGASLVLATGRGVLGGRWPVGEVIDRAARLLRARLPAGGRAAGGPAPRDAPPPVQLDETTAGLLDGRFETTAGAGGPALRAETPRHETTRTLLGRPTTMVGRDRELRVIADAFEASVAEGAARAVLVTGAPGVGKSRLRWEVVRALAQRPEPPAVWMGRGDPMRAGAPLGLLADAVGSALGLRDGDAVAVQQGKLRARAGLHFAGAERDRVAAFLGVLCGVPFDDGDDVQLRAARRDALLMGDQVRRAWLDWLRAECAAQPVVLVLEDLHWGDGPTVRLVDAALRDAADRPLLVLALARPEVHQLFPGLWAERALVEQRLGELSRKASERLVREVLGDAVTSDAMARLCERAAGNAFYLEELCRGVAEGRADALPETVLAMVQVRLEALPAELRRALRAASVFGQAFWRGAVRALLGDPPDGDVSELLGHLAERELIARRGAGRFQGEEECSFRHDPVREAAYAMLTDEDRALGHRLAGEWLASKGEHDALMVAEHLERGGAPERAVPWFHRAVEQALGANDFAAAVARAGRALAAGAAGETAGKLWLLQAEAHRWRGELAEATRCAGEATARLPPGSALWFRALEEGVAAEGRLGGYGRVRELAEAAVGQATAVREAGAAVAAIVCLCSVGRQLFHAGSYQVADAVIAAVEGLAGDMATLEPGVAAQVHGLRAARARHVGDLAGDLRGYQAVLDAFERAGDGRNSCNTRVSVGFAHVELGDHARAEAELRRALGDADRMGLLSVATRARQNLGLVLAARGALEEAMALETRTIEESRAHGNARFEGWTRIYLAAMALQAGDAARAEQEARSAAAQLAVTPPARAGALAVLARALVARGHADEAVAASGEAMATLDALGGIEEFEALVRVAQAEALAAAGRRDEAKCALAAARNRLHDRAALIGDVELRARFLAGVPENARTLALARAWLPDDRTSGPESGPDDRPKGEPDGRPNDRLNDAGNEPPADTPRDPRYDPKE